MRRARNSLASNNEHKSKTDGLIGSDHSHAESGGARTELERNRSALAIFTERERECAQF